MAEISITLTNASGADRTVGERVAIGSSAGFNHYALVQSGRSRSDAYDFKLWHSTYGVIPFLVANPNTSACEIEWELPTNILDGGSDNAYRLRFGNIGAQVSPFSTFSGLSYALTVAYSVPSVALPSATIGDGFTWVHDVDASDAASVRRGIRNLNARRVWQLRWENIPPEDWYEIRAFTRSVLGGAGKWSAPSWFQRGSGNDMRFRETPALTQTSRLGFHAAASVEEVIV